MEGQHADLKKAFWLSIRLCRSSRLGIRRTYRLEDLQSNTKNHPQVLALRVRTLVHEKEWLKLTFLAEGLLSAFPALSGVWYDLGKARAQLGELEAARVALKRA